MKALASILSLVFATTAIAQQPAGSTKIVSLVPTFADKCMMPTIDYGDRVAALDEDPNWQRASAITFDIPKMGDSEDWSAHPSFDRYSSAQQWDGFVEGHKASFLVFEHRDDKFTCALIIEGLEHARRYWSEFGRTFRPFHRMESIQGSGVHWLALIPRSISTAKIEGAEEIYGQIDSRSQAGSIEKTTHFYVSF